MLGSKIRELRRQKKLTQKELAKQLNVSTGALGFWEIGKREPDMEMLIKIATFFNVSLDYLVGNNSNNNTITIIGRNGTYKTFELSDKNIEILEQLAETMIDNNKV